jgi:hypothetical protein
MRKVIGVKLTHLRPDPLETSKAVTYETGKDHEWGVFDGETTYIVAGSAEEAAALRATLANTPGVIIDHENSDP